MMEVGGQPSLAYQIARIKRSAKVDAVVLATTAQESDAPVRALGAELGVGVFEGEEADVLGRVAGAARATGAKIVVRLTGDCPLIDPALIDQTVDLLEESGADVSTNSYPRTFPIGMDVEVVRGDALFEADRLASDSYEREHVMPYLYAHPDRYQVARLRSDKDLSGYRLTMDMKEDLELIRRIADHFGDQPFGAEEIVALLDERPEWKALNQGIAQKVRRHEVAKA